MTMWMNVSYLIAPRDGITSLGQARRDGRDGAVRFGRYPAHVVVTEHVHPVDSGDSVASAANIPIDVGVRPEGVPERFGQVVLGQVGNYGGQFRLVVRMEEVLTVAVPDRSGSRRWCRLLVNFGQMLLGNVIFQGQ